MGFNAIQCFVKSWYIFLKKGPTERIMDSMGKIPYYFINSPLLFKKDKDMMRKDEKK